MIILNRYFYDQKKIILLPEALNENGISRWRYYYQFRFECRDLKLKSDLIIILSLNFLLPVEIYIGGNFANIQKDAETAKL